MTSITQAPHSATSWNALMRELRSVKAGTLSSPSDGLHSRKKRRAKFDQQDLSVAGDAQERKVRCRRNSSTTPSGDLLEESNTFLDLTPPSTSLGASPRFTFGKHYKQISLASLANSSCACAGKSSEFDVFSSFRCPCKSRSKTPKKAAPSRKTVSSTKKSRVAEAI